MATIKFYSFTDDEDGSRLIFEQIESRFLDEYTLAETEFNYDEDEEEFTLSINVLDCENMSDIDQILCEEICHEYEVYCSISDGSGKSNNYYYDEEDEWFIK